jgi:hypothetical protein
MHFGIVNGPLMGKTLPVAARRLWLDRFEDGERKPLVYAEVSEALYTDEGLPLMAVEGTEWAFSTDCGYAFFAHPDWPPTLLDLRTGTVHPCSLTQPNQDRSPIG